MGAELRDSHHKRIYQFLRSQGTFVPETVLLDHLFGDDPEGGPLNARNVLGISIYRLRRIIGHDMVERESAYRLSPRLVSVPESFAFNQNELHRYHPASTRRIRASGR